MDSIELFFAVISVGALICALFTRLFLAVAFFGLIGASPYITAGSLSLAVLARLALRAKPTIKVSLSSGIYLGWILFCILGSFSVPLVPFLSQLAQIVFIALICIFFQNTQWRQDQRILLASAFIGSGVLLATLTLIIHFYGFTVESSALLKSEPSNYAALYLVLTTFIAPALIPSLQSRRILVVKLSVYLLGFSAIAYNDARAAMLVAIFSLVASNARLLVVMLLVGLGGLFIGFAALSAIMLQTEAVSDPKSILSLFNFEGNFSNLERLAMLKLSFDTLLSNPFGLGLGSSAGLFVGNSVTVLSHYPHPHNTLAHMAVEFGWFGVGLYIYFLLLLIRAWFSANKTAVESYFRMLFFAFLLLSQAEAISYNGLVMLFFCIAYFLGFINEPDTKKSH
ncbi:O-antigen ligase family protein [Luminiphilus sp.]|nr:O-antigen ligase family protein [Luminiphilus sp.]